MKQLLKSDEVLFNITDGLLVPIIYLGERDSVGCMLSIVSDLGNN